MRALIATFVLSSLTLGMTWAEEQKTAPVKPVSEAIKLVKAKLGKKVLLAWVEALPAYAPLTSQSILDLKKNDVPEEVIEAMIRHASKPTKKEAKQASALAKVQRPVQQEQPKVTGKLSRVAEDGADKVRYRYRSPIRTVSLRDNASVYYMSSYPYYSRSYNPYYADYYSSYFPSLSFSYHYSPHRYHNYGHYRHYGSYGGYGHYGHRGHRGHSSHRGHRGHRGGSHHRR